MNLLTSFGQWRTAVFRDKANDVFDLERRVMNQLTGGSKDRLASVSEPVIVICHQLTPADAATFNHENVLGIATDVGGRTDHSSIVAAAIGVPVVVGCKSVAEEVSDGDMLILDGKSGTVIIAPDEETISRMRQNIELLESFKQKHKRSRNKNQSLHVELIFTYMAILNLHMKSNKLSIRVVKVLVCTERSFNILRVQLIAN